MSLPYDLSLFVSRPMSFSMRVGDLGDLLSCSFSQVGQFFYKQSQEGILLGQAMGIVTVNVDGFCLITLLGGSQVCDPHQSSELSWHWFSC